MPCINGGSFEIMSKVLLITYLFLPFLLFFPSYHFVLFFIHVLFVAFKEKELYLEDIERPLLRLTCFLSSWVPGVP